MALCCRPVVTLSFVTLIRDSTTEVCCIGWHTIALNRSFRHKKVDKNDDIFVVRLSSKKADKNSQLLQVRAWFR